MDVYIYRASLSSVVFLPSHSVTDLHKLGREVLLASLGISTDLIQDSAFCPDFKLAFVPVLESGQGFRDKSLEPLSGVAELGQKVPDVKKIFAHHGIRSQDLLPSTWFPCQLT